MDLRHNKSNVYFLKDPVLAFDFPQRFVQLKSQQQKNRPIFLLVTADGFLAQGFCASFFPYYQTSYFSTLNEACQHPHDVAAAHLIIDVESLAEPALATFDSLRKGCAQACSQEIDILANDRDREIISFIEATGSYKFINRKSAISKLKKRLAEPMDKAVPRRKYFSNADWSLLLSLACGRSLRAIAGELHCPYHRIIYRLNVILERLQLPDRMALIQLLHRLSCSYCSHSCVEKQ